MFSNLPDGIYELFHFFLIIFLCAVGLTAAFVGSMIAVALALRGAYVRIIKWMLGGD